MNEFYERSTGQIIDETAFRAKFPDKTFPAILDKETLLGQGFVPILEAPEPVTTVGQIAVKVGVMQDPKNNLVYKWEVRDLPSGLAAANLAGLKANRWKEIQVIRDKKIAGGVKVGDKWFHTDTGSLVQYLSMLAARTSLPEGISWKTMDGSKVTMTSDLVMSIYQSALLSTNTIYNFAEDLKASMEASNDPTNFDISKDWPIVYSEIEYVEKAQKAAAIEAAKEHVLKTAKAADTAILTAVAAQEQADTAKALAISTKAESDANPTDNALKLAASTAQKVATAEQASADASLEASNASSAVADAAEVALAALLV